MSGSQPTVTVAIPTLNEERHIEGCLEAVKAQTYSSIVQVLVIDGGSSDRTRELAARCGATIVDNPRRIQAAALNVALQRSSGDVFVRVDGHCRIAPDYVEQCVAALQSTGAALVGGAMTPDARGWKERGIAVAMSSRFGAGPARFHVGGPAGWADTVYLGCCRTELAREIGGYSEDVGVNEDSEFAIRMQPRGGVWFDPAIRSTYTPRDTLRGVARQFYRYGRSRAATVRRHPGSMRARQLLPPVLVLGLVSPRRRVVVLSYAALLATAAAAESRRAGRGLPVFVAALPLMHLPWGMGFIVGLVGGPPRAARALPEHTTTESVESQEL